MDPKSSQQLSADGDPSVSFFPPPPTSSPQRQRTRRESVADIVVPTSTMKHHTSVKMSQFNVEKLAQTRKRLCNRLYGRDEEVKLVRDELDWVCQGHRSLVLIHGLKGQGKRALAAQLEAPAQKRGALWVEFGLTRDGTREPYSGIKTALRQLCKLVGALPKRKGDSHLHSLEGLQDTVAKKLNWELSLLCQVIPELSILSNSLTRQLLLKQKESSRHLLRNYKRSMNSTTNTNDSGRLFTIPESVQGSVATRTSTYTSTTYGEVHKLKGNVRSAPERLQHALRRLLHVLSGYAPLLFVCNDAQYADGESLKLFSGWVTDKQNPSLMLMFTYQSDQVSDDHVLCQTIQKIKKSSKEETARIQEIELLGLSQESVNQLIADLLDVPSPDETLELTSIIYRKTFGNTFYVHQYMVSLAQKGHLIFELAALKWSWSVDDVKNSLTATDSVVDLMKHKLQTSSLARKILPLAACLGSTFEVWILQAVLKGIQELEGDEDKQLFAKLLSCKEDKDDDDGSTTTTTLISSVTNNQLELLEQQGLIEAAAGEASYSFIHPEVIAGALALVGNNEDLANAKFLIGCILLDARQLMEEPKADSILFLVVDLLNSRPPKQVPRDKRSAVRDMNIAAGDEAYLAAAFRPAARYYGVAIELLPFDHWITLYDLSLHLFTSAAEAEMCLGNYARMEDYTDRVLEVEGMAILEKMAIYEVSMSALLAQKRVPEAWDQCLEVLHKAKSYFPTHGTKTKTAMSVAMLKLHPKHWKPEYLEKLPVSEDPLDEEITKIHDKQIEMALMVKPNVFPLTIFTAVQHVIDRGLTRYSASVLSWFGVLLCGVLGDFEWGAANLKFVYSLMDRFENKLIECRVIVVSTLNVAHWMSSIHEVGKEFITGYTIGMETSDLVTAFWGAFFYHEDAFCSGTNLNLLAKDAELYSKQMEDYGMLNHLQNLQSIHKLISQLRGVVPREEASDANDADAEQKGLRNHLAHSTKDRLLGAAFFGDWELGAKLGVKYMELIGKVLLGQFASVASRFITSLCCFEMARRRCYNRKKYHRVAMKNFKIIQQWCHKKNPNTQHYLLFLKAEKVACKGDTEKAVNLYREAILFAGRSGFNHKQALAYERLAALYSRLGDNISAKYSLEDAVRLYDEWGAAKKVELIKEQLGKM